MKKFILFLAVAGMTTFASCSSDDDGGSQSVTAITLAASSLQVDLGAQVDLTVATNLGTDVTADATYTANGTALTGPTFSSNTAGTYNIVATYNGIASNAVSVTVLPAIYALHNGVAIFPTRNALIYYGTGDILGDGVDRSYWTYLTYIGTALADYETSSFVSEIDFFTIPTETAIVLPDAGNNEFYTLYSLKVNNAVVVETDAEGTVNGTGTVVTSNIADDASSASFVANVTYNTNKTLKVNYVDGVNEFVNASGRPAARGNMSVESVSLEEIKARKAAFSFKK